MSSAAFAAFCSTHCSNFRFARHDVFLFAVYKAAEARDKRGHHE